MKQLFLYAILASITLFTTQCKKEGPVGPEGPQGSEGPAGPRGATGAPGSSSVRSKTVKLTNAQWGNNTTTHWFNTSAGVAVGHNARYVDINEALITQAIMDNGLVQVYFMPYDGTTAYTSLPYSRQNAQLTYNINVDYTYQLGKVRLLFFLTGSYGAPATPSVSTWTIPSYTFKYIIIPGTAIAGRYSTSANNTEKLIQLKGNIYTETEIKNMPYGQLCQLLDIKE